MAVPPVPSDATRPDDRSAEAAPDAPRATQALASPEASPSEASSSEASSSEAEGSVADRLMAFVAPVQGRLERSPRYRLARLAYHQNQHVGPAALFVGGFGWDALTLQRVDALLDNVILGGYLAALGVFLVLSLLAEHGQLASAPLQRLQTWFPGLAQFFAGGLFSAYVVYFSQSASFTTTGLFVLVLVGVLLANEFLFERFQHVVVLAALYFLAAFCFFTFFLPVVTGRMGYAMFALGGVVSLVPVALGLALLRRWAVIDAPRRMALALGAPVGLLVTLNVFYLLNWMPPVPLALRDAGIYHDVTRTDDAYALTYEAPPWHRPWDDADDVFRYDAGDAVYCFAAVFAPTHLRARIVHHWQHFDTDADAWVTTDRIDYKLTGGRFRGYRGFTRKRHVRPGAWRVDVETAEGRLVGRVRFEIVEGDTARTVTYKTRRYR